MWEKVSGKQEDPPILRKKCPACAREIPVHQTICNNCLDTPLIKSSTPHEGWMFTGFADDEKAVNSGCSRDPGEYMTLHPWTSGPNRPAEENPVQKAAPAKQSEGADLAEKEWLAELAKEDGAKEAVGIAADEPEGVEAKMPDEIPDFVAEEIEEAKVRAPPEGHSLNHDGTHPNCKWCKIAKQKRLQSKTVPPDEKVVADKWGGNVSFDHLDSKSNLSIGGDRYGLVVQDEWSGAVGSYPTAT